MNRVLVVAALLVPMTVCAGCMGYQSGNARVKQAFQQNDLPAKNSSEADILTRFGPPNSKTDAAGQTTYTWVYVEAGPKHPGLIWIPIVGLFFIGAESQQYTITATCEDGVVTTVSTTQGQGQFGQ